MYTNNKNLSLSVAVWLATDEYKREDKDFKKVISATELLNSVRQIILGRRISESITDVSHLAHSRLGTAMHSSIENAWKKNYRQSMDDLGYPQEVIDRIRINPLAVYEHDIPIYLEKRFYKQLGDWTVTGQPDFIGDGRLEDFKKTSAYVYQNNVKDDDYIMQGSIYRWGLSDIITSPVIAIQFFINNFEQWKTKTDNYPPSVMFEKLYKLKPVIETEAWMRTKLNQVDKYENTDEPNLPECTDEELWKKPSVWRYFSNPAKTSRATKIFDTYHEAHLRFVKDGSKGIILEKASEPTACRYCSAAPICTQKDKYIKAGTLVL